MKKDIENQLKNYYQISQSMGQSGGMEDTLFKTKQLLRTRETPLPFWKFFFSQFYFIRKRVWAIQFTIVALCIFALFSISEITDAITIISAASPLIVLASIFELSLSYVHGTIELELSTRYSFKHLMLSRITILALVDIFCLTILLVFCGLLLSKSIGILILYLFVPFFVTSCGCLWLLNHTDSKECNNYLTAYGLFISMSVAIITSQFTELYEASAIGIWVAAFFLTLIGVLLEVYRTIKNCTAQSMVIKLCDTGRNY